MNWYQSVQYTCLWSATKISHNKVKSYGYYILLIFTSSQYLSPKYESKHSYYHLESEYENHKKQILKKMTKLVQINMYLLIGFMAYVICDKKDAAAVQLTI